MNDSLIQFINLLRSIPFSKKISMAFVLILVVTGFVFMFFLANREDYQVLFNNLSSEDGGAIISKLKERNIPYKFEANGAIIMVPAEKVYELRLTLARNGLPNGGNVGFEIFDQPDFRTTKFVQELNYRRALQGELARTINQFKEVKDTRVFIVIPKESLFVEDRKPASASIQLNLRSSLPPSNIAAIVHLVASAVEGLVPEQITVVDTKGRLIFKGGNRRDTSFLLNNTQLEYKRKVENEIKENVQTMLEGIVGAGKAIVRVSAEIDFNKITINEEEYDPSATAIRSSRNIEESSQSGESNVETAQTLINQQRGVVKPSAGTQKQRTKKDIATNYEINKIIRTILKPAGTIKRLSVAAIIDEIYKLEKLEDGTMKKIYTPRTENELRKYQEIVEKAMGYNDDREDQVSVSSIPFLEAIPQETKAIIEDKEFDLLKLVQNYRKIIVNLILVVMVFFLVIKPLLKSIKNITGKIAVERKELPPGSDEYAQISEIKEVNQRKIVQEMSKSNPEKSQQLIRGWIGEQE